MPPSNAILAPWVAAATRWSLWQNIFMRSHWKNDCIGFFIWKNSWHCSILMTLTNLPMTKWNNCSHLLRCHEVMRSHWDNWLLWLLTTLTEFSVMAAKTSIAGRRTILPHPLRMESQSSLRRGNVQVQSHEIKKIGGMICMMMGILGMKPGKNRFICGDNDDEELGMYSKNHAASSSSERYYYHNKFFAPRSSAWLNSLCTPVFYRRSRIFTKKKCWPGSPLGKSAVLINNLPIYHSCESPPLCNPIKLFCLVIPNNHPHLYPLGHMAVCQNQTAPFCSPQIAASYECSSKYCTLWLWLT